MYSSCTCIASINSQNKAEWKEGVDHAAWWVCLTPEAMVLTMALATSYAYSLSEPAEHKMRGLLQSAICSECLDPLPAGWMFISLASVCPNQTLPPAPGGRSRIRQGESVARVQQLQLGQEIRRLRPALSAPKSPLHQHSMRNPNTSHCRPPGLHSCLESVRQGHFSPWHCTHST